MAPTRQDRQLPGVCPFVAAASVWRCFTARKSRAGIYPGRVLDLNSLDLEEIANALAGQTDYEHRWLINPTDR
jgi:hypothetical protein